MDTIPATKAGIKVALLFSLDAKISSFRNL
jgi:hypothetical protein